MKALDLTMKSIALTTEIAVRKIAYVRDTIGYIYSAGKI